MLNFNVWPRSRTYLNDCVNWTIEKKSGCEKLTGLPTVARRWKGSGIVFRRLIDWTYEFKSAMLANIYITKAIAQMAPYKITLSLSPSKTWVSVQSSFLLTFSRFSDRIKLLTSSHTMGKLIIDKVDNPWNLAHRWWEHLSGACARLSLCFCGL